MQAQSQPIKTETHEIKKAETEARVDREEAEVEAAAALHEAPEDLAAIEGTGIGEGNTEANMKEMEDLNIGGTKSKSKARLLNPNKNFRMCQRNSDFNSSGSSLTKAR